MRFVLIVKFKKHSVPKVRYFQSANALIIEADCYRSDQIDSIEVLDQRTGKTYSLSQFKLFARLQLLDQPPPADLIEDLARRVAEAEREQQGSIKAAQISEAIARCPEAQPRRLVMKQSTF